LAQVTALAVNWTLKRSGASGATRAAAAGRIAPSARTLGGPVPAGAASGRAVPAVPSAASGRVAPAATPTSGGAALGCGSLRTLGATSGRGLRRAISSSTSRLDLQRAARMRSASFSGVRCGARSRPVLRFKAPSPSIAISAGKRRAARATSMRT
jgi:hypothetical protein